MEKSISSKDNPSGTILHEPTYTILGVTRCIQCFHSDFAQFKILSILWSVGDAFAVLPTYHRSALESFELGKGLAG